MPHVGWTSTARLRRIVQGRQILLHGAAGPLRITIPVPVLTRDRALLIGIGLDQAGIDCEAFASNQTGRNVHVSMTRSNTRRKTSPSRKRSLRARENAE